MREPVNSVQFKGKPVFKILNSITVTRYSHVIIAIATQGVALFTLMHQKQTKISTVNKANTALMKPKNITGLGLFEFGQNNFKDK